jgi:carnosine synthase
MTPRHPTLREAGAVTVLDDADFPQQWIALQNTLRSFGLPPARDRRGRRPDPLSEVPVARPGDCLLFLQILESQWAKTVSAPFTLPPGTAVWALCTSWLRREGSKLWCYRGIWADRGGQLYLDDFDPPREVTYFANHFTEADTYGQRNDGIAFEAGLACPASSTTEITSFISCKVTTRLLAAERGVPVPRSMALARSFAPLLPALAKRLADGGIVNVRLETIDGAAGLAQTLAQVRATVDAGLSQWPDSIRTIVVKPSGLFHMQGLGVSFHDRSDLEGIARATAELLCGRGASRFLPEDAVLIDEFCGGIEHTLRVRAVVARTGEAPEDCALQIAVASTGSSGRIISGITELPQTLDSALANWGAGAAETARLHAQIEQYSLAAFAANAARDPLDDHKPGGRTDLLGMDFIMALPGDEQRGQRALEPVLIEVNNHDCTDVVNLLAFNAIDHRAPGVFSPTLSRLDEYFRAMAARSQRHRLEGRTVLVIGGVMVAKRPVWESARRHGVRIVVVNHRPVNAEDGFGPELADGIVVPGLDDDHSDAGEQARCDRIVSELARRGIVPDGVVTFWEDCTVLTALVAEQLGTRWHRPAAQRTVKDKLRTQRALAEKPEVYIDAVEPNARGIGLPFAELLEPADIHSDAALAVPFPAILKQRFGAGSVAVRRVATREEAVVEAERLFGLLRDRVTAARVYDGCGFTFGSGPPSLLLSAFAEGSEHDVEIILFDGEFIDAWVTDKSETELPFCSELCQVVPSRLSEARQNQVINAAYQACRRAGLSDGVMNVQIKLTASGPRIIEINGRMAGFYVPAWTRILWGYDLPAAVYQIACGIRPAGRVRRRPLCALAGVLLYPNDGADVDAVADPDMHRVVLGRPRDHHNLEYTEPLASLGWAAPDPAHAIERLLSALPRVFAGNPERAAMLHDFVLRMPA